MVTGDTKDNLIYILYTWWRVYGVLTYMLLFYMCFSPFIYDFPIVAF